MTRPTALVLEDAHALDPLSRDLLVAVCRAVPDLPVVVLLAYRPDVEPLLGLPVQGVLPVTEVGLDALEPADAQALATQLLEDLVEPGSRVVADLVPLVVERAEGNPLWVRELCRYLHEQALDPSGARLVDGLELPGSLHGLVLSRLDALAEGPRRTAKVASVIGRTFAAPLVGLSHPELGAEADVRRFLATLQERDVADVEDLTTATWYFTHSVLREVAYDSLPFAMRTRLHGQVAAALESGVLGDPGRYLPQLALHWWLSDDDGKKRTYLRLAGEQAQESYANDAALLHYRRLLTVLDDEARGEVHVRIGKVLELRGEWAEAAGAFGQAYELAGRLGDGPGLAWSCTWVAEVARKQGQYVDAEAGLAEAAGRFAALGDDAGTAQVLHLSGTLAAQQGLLALARERYEQALEIRERLDDPRGRASLLSNLAVVAEYEGDYAGAERLGERALALRQELRDRWGIGVSLNNLGMLATLRHDPETAKARFAESMALHREVGDGPMVALGLNNLGNVHRDLGEREEAGRYYRDALAQYRRFGDEWAVAMLYEDVVLLAADGPNPAEAFWLLGACDAARDRLGSPRTPDAQARLDAALAAHLATLGDAADALRSYGGELAPAEVDGLLRRICS